MLGFTFLFLQAFEYFHAYNELNLTLRSGVYGSTFFLLTGFHGFHVFLGGTMLTVVLVRLIRGHFTADHHFAFEGAAWYWHLWTSCGWGCTSWCTGCDAIRPAPASVWYPDEARSLAAAGVCPRRRGGLVVA